MTFFAKVARKEGHQKLADYFEETARNEHEHAKLLFKLLSGISNTKDNLKVAMTGEQYENESMYPKFAKVAEKEGFTDAKELFEKLARVEKEHEDRFKSLLEKLENQTLYSDNKKVAWVCKKCGNVEYGESAPQKCPVCNHPQGYFEKRCEN
jgi:rubrerythrin